MSDFRRQQKPTTATLLHFAARNGQEHFQKLSSQLSTERTMLIMAGGGGMKQKVDGGQATAYG
jgi:hypothetical protein